MKKSCFALVLAVGCLAAPSADAQSWRAGIGTASPGHPLLIPVLDLGGGDRGGSADRGGGNSTGGSGSSGGGGERDGLSDLGDRIGDRVSDAVGGLGDALGGRDNNPGGGPGGAGGGNAGSGASAGSAGAGSAASGRADGSAGGDGPGERVSPALTSLLGRIDALDRDLKGLRRQQVASLSGASLGVSAIGAASVEGRLAALAQATRAASGELHREMLRSGDMRQRLEQAERQLEEIFADIDLAMTVDAPKPALSREPSETSLPARTSNRPPAASTDSQDQFYEAVQILGTGKAAQARALLRDFLTANPDDALAPNARYWLGETYFAGGDFTSAGWIYAEAYEQDPGGPFAADNLLKLGMALAMLEKRRLACATFDKLAADFASDSPQVSAGRQQGGSIGCE